MWSTLLACLGDPAPTGPAPRAPAPASVPPTPAPGPEVRCDELPAGGWRGEGVGELVVLQDAATAARWDCLPPALRGRLHAEVVRGELHLEGYLDVAELDATLPCRADGWFGGATTLWSPCEGGDAHTRVQVTRSGALAGSLSLSEGPRGQAAQLDAAFELAPATIPVDPSVLVGRTWHFDLGLGVLPGEPAWLDGGRLAVAVTAAHGDRVDLTLTPEGPSAGAAVAVSDVPIDRWGVAVAWPPRLVLDAPGVGPVALDDGGLAVELEPIGVAALPILVGRHDLRLVSPADADAICAVAPCDACADGEDRCAPVQFLDAELVATPP